MIKFLLNLLLLILMVGCIVVSHYSRKQIELYGSDDCNNYKRRVKNFKFWFVRVCAVMMYFFTSIMSCISYSEEFASENLSGWYWLWFCIFCSIHAVFIIVLLSGIIDDVIIPFCLPINSLIKTYHCLDKNGTKIDFKTFKNVMKVCPENVKVWTDSYSFDYDNKRKYFYFDNFFTFVRADLFLARRASNQKKKESANTAALELMHQAIEDKLNKFLNETMVAAQESKNIMERMSK